MAKWPTVFALALQMTLAPCAIFTAPRTSELFGVGPAVE